MTNGILTVSADTAGAELHSISMGGTEYLWQCGDAWRRYAPVLFPFICSPGNKSYRADGKEYIMPTNHGFARDSEFECLPDSDGTMSFLLSSDEATKKVYPYDFELKVSYCFDSQDSSTLRVINEVKNTGDRQMYFYLGGHPAFNCPLEEGLGFDDYYVEYSEPETIVQVWNGTRTVIENSRKLSLTRALFDNDVVMKDAPRSDSVTLKSSKGSKGVTLSWDDTLGCIAVWSPTGNDDAKFVCLEPWTSVPVYEDDGCPDIEEKKHAVKLGAGCSFTFEYKIKVF